MPTPRNTTPKRFKVRYSYLVTGTAHVYAKTSQEAKAIFTDADDYGDAEQTSKHRAITATLCPRNS